MSKRILPAVFLGLAIASHAVLAQDMGTTPGADSSARLEQASSSAGVAPAGYARSIGAAVRNLPDTIGANSEQT
jgi:hypothetical protein